MARAASLERDFSSISDPLPSGILQFQRAPFDETTPFGEHLKGVGQ